MAVIEKIQFGEQEIAFTFKKSARARMVRITALRGEGFVVTVPRGVTPEYVRRILLGKQSWILKRLSYAHAPKMRESIGWYREKREEALGIIEQCVDVSNKYYKFDLQGVFVRNQKTRWGSCSQQKNVTFNYHVAYLPEHLREYVVVHELCHLRELNHSRNFWKLVAQTIPDHASRRKELRKYSLR